MKIEKTTITLLRPHQWLKNGFIAAPMFFAFELSMQNIKSVVIAIIIFSLCASAVYIFNDIHDVEEDKKHPDKCERPVASGAITLPTAFVLTIVLAGLSCFLAFMTNTKFFMILILYALMNILYTLKLKHIAIVDIVIIAIGFVLRLFAGAAVIDIDVSMWIVIVTFLLALFLAAAKRRDEYINYLDGKKVRKNIDGYNLEMLNAIIVLLASVTVVAYIMYTVSPLVIQRIGSNKLYLTTGFVIVGILRYLQLTYVFQKSGSPTKVVLKDRFLQIVIILWLLSFYVIHVWVMYAAKSGH